MATHARQRVSRMVNPLAILTMSAVLTMSRLPTVSILTSLASTHPRMDAIVTRHTSVAMLQSVVVVLPLQVSQLVKHGVKTRVRLAKRQVILLQHMLPSPHRLRHTAVLS